MFQNQETYAAFGMSIFILIFFVFFGWIIIRKVRKTRNLLSDFSRNCSKYLTNKNDLNRVFQILKGFVLDDERLKQGKRIFGKDYFAIWGGTRYLPMAFSEHGVLMLSSVLKSERAI